MADLSTLNQFPVKELKIGDISYPFLLKQVPDAPTKLYYRGNLPDKLFTIAIVGSRRMTLYGQRAIEKIISNFPAGCISIVSGLALGTDGFAHRMALQYQHHTVAVLGSGVSDSTIFPRENFHLAQRILNSGGAVLSEYPENAFAAKYHFPARNRIISGLSRCVVITEAKTKSGALITADFCLDQNRDLFALPGSVFSAESKGTNQLIKSGAYVIASAQDLIEKYDELKSNPTGILPLPSNVSDLEKAVLEILQKIKVSKWENRAELNEKLLKTPGVSIASISEALTNLELRDLVENQGNKIRLLN